MNKKIMTELKTEEKEQKQNLRPISFDTYIGQEEIKEHLKISIEAAKKRNKSISHILLYGPPGLGKTTLAGIIANQMNKKIIYTSAPSIEKPADIASLLLQLNTGDILFIDEVHSLKKQFEEILYPAMEDFKLDISIQDGSNNKIMRIDLPNFTLIGATTNPGNLTNPFRDRFMHCKQLKYYTQEELVRIINRSSKIMDLEIHEEAAKKIAERSRGTARIANNLLSLVGDYAIVENNSIINNEITEKALNSLNIDKKGLDYLDRKILKTIYINYNNKPVGLKNLASAIGEDKETIEYMSEPYLMQINLLTRTHRGRILTEEGISYIKNILDKE